MPDLNDLDDFNQGLPRMDFLPPSEIRRRGDRLRRRRTSMVAVGGVLAAAIAVGAPVIALSGDDGTRTDGTQYVATDPPAPRPTVTDVPDGFPVGDGMGTASDPAQVGTDVGEVVFASITVCEDEVWLLDSGATPTVDALGAVWSDGVSGGEQRTLATYADEQAARSALSAIGSAVADCPPPVVRGDGFAIEPKALTAAGGEETLAYVDRYLDADGYTGEGNVFVLTRVGNALLIDKTYIGGAGDLAVAQDTADLLADRATGVVDAMCVFSADGCPG